LSEGLAGHETIDATVLGHALQQAAERAYKAVMKPTEGTILTVARVVGERAATAAMEHGVRRVEVQVKGPGSGRDTAVRSIQNTGLEVTSIKDVTPLAHNGCSQPKRKRN
jgi:ribosomal protein S11